MPLDSMTVNFTVRRVPDTATVYGQVVWVLYKTGLDGAKIEIPGVGYTLTDANGDYVLSEVPVGTHIVRFSNEAARAIPQEVEIIVSKDENYRLDFDIYFNKREFLEINTSHPKTISGFRPTEIRGKLSVTDVKALKTGMAGVENDAEVFTDTGILVVEAVDWYYDTWYGGGEKAYQVGCVIYKGGHLVYNPPRVPVPLGEVVDYGIFISGGTVFVIMWDSTGTPILNVGYEAGAQYIRGFATYFEFWWYPEEGTFDFQAYHIIERLYDPSYGWKTAAECLWLPPADERESWHRNEMLHWLWTVDGDHYRLDGGVIDPGMP